MVNPLWSRFVAVIRLAKAWAFVGRFLFKRPGLPPGRLENLPNQVRKNQKYLLENFEKYGDIFKVRKNEKLVICLLGLPLCHRLVHKHGEQLQADTFSLKPLIPKGFLREMEGKDHKKYRSIILRALQTDILESNRDYYTSRIRQIMDGYSRNPAQPAPPRESYENVLRSLLRSIFFNVFFGARKHTPLFDRLEAAYNTLMIDDKPWFFGIRQKQSFLDLKRVWLELLKNEKFDQAPDFHKSILGRVHAAGAVDDNSLGQILVMVQTGSYDLLNFLVWLTKYAADNPRVFSRVSREPLDSTNDRPSLAQAFVYETFRLNRIEFLMRIVTSDFVFENHLFPKGSIVRMCLWESHKSPVLFPEPFKFKPERYLHRQFSLEEFAPFGFGIHRCPFSSVSVNIAALIARTISEYYCLEGFNNGPPVMGTFHYEPAKEFTVKLRAKQLDNKQEPVSSS